LWLRETRDRMVHTPDWHLTLDLRPLFFEFKVEPIHL
jgi:hypothetical protein